MEDLLSLSLSPTLKKINMESNKESIIFYIQPVSASCSGLQAASLCVLGCGGGSFDGGVNCLVHVCACVLFGLVTSEGDRCRIA